MLLNPTPFPGGRDPVCAGMHKVARPYPSTPTSKWGDYSDRLELNMLKRNAIFLFSHAKVIMLGMWRGPCRLVDICSGSVHLSSEVLYGRHISSNFLAFDFQFPGKIPSTLYNDGGMFSGSFSEPLLKSCCGKIYLLSAPRTVSLSA